MKNPVRILCFLFLLTASAVRAQSTLDATRISANYYNSIVKILLFDSLAEKNHPGTGYIGRGSGFFVTEDGIIFTNRHVVQFCSTGYMEYIYSDPSTHEHSREAEGYSREKMNDPNIFSVERVGHPCAIVQVYSDNRGDEYKLYYAKVIALDMGSFDGAMIKIVSDLNGNPVTEKFHPVLIGNSDSTQQGEDLCVYGFPAQIGGGFNIMLNDASTLTSGKHSGFDYVFNVNFGYIKVDASINGGNSGGPVFNKNYKVIGIATATGNKTNIGLVGGINGMYSIVKQDTALLRKLTDAGLHPPPKKALASSNVVTGANVPIITPVQIKKLNADKLFVNKFQKKLYYMRMHFSPAPSELLTIVDPGSFPTKDVGVPFSMVSGPEFGADFGRWFALWHPSPFLKLSFDAGYLGISFHGADARKIVLDTTGIIDPKYYSLGPVYIYTSLGPVFSAMLFKRMSIDAWFKIVPTFVGGNDIMDYNVTVPGYYNVSHQFKNAFGLCYESGVQLRYQALTLGVSYVTGKYSFDILTTTTSNTQSGDPPRGHVSCKRQTLFFTLGIGLSKKAK